MKESELLRKVTCPALPSTILHREALVGRLNDVIVGPASRAIGRASPYKLVLLHAPAGYGKTTLLVDFAQQMTIPCCWYILDRSDINLSVFLTTLLVSIRQAFPQFGTSLDSLLAAVRAIGTDQSIEYRLETVVEAFSEALATELSERFALMLCNYHEVNESQEINIVVNRLMRGLPSQGVLVIESRVIPDLDFVPLLARREMCGMSSDIFRLTAQEIHDLATLQGVSSLNAKEAERLAALFDGWMAGVLVGTRLGGIAFLQKGASTHLQGVPAVALDRQHLFAYVVNEVFRRSPDLYSFLKDVSVLEEMKPSICAALLECSDAAECLQDLEHQGLFVTRSGADPDTIYTCHPVLRNLLVEELRQQIPDRFALLHRRAAELLGAAQDYEHAITHAFAAGADELAARLILEASNQLLSQGYVETLIHWIDALPITIRDRSAQLLLLRARLHCIIGDYLHALPLLAAAQEALKRTSPEDDSDALSTVQVEIMLLQGNVLFHRSAYQEAQELCHQALALLSPDEVALRSEAYMRLGLCVELLGDFHTGLVYLQKALQLRSRFTAGHQVAEVHATLSSIYNFLGNFALAEHHLTYVITYCEQIHDVWEKVNSLIHLGVLKKHQGILVEAEATLTQAQSLANASHLLRLRAYALVNIGEIYQEQGLYDRSLKLIEDGWALARQGDDTYLINWTLCVLAMTYLYLGDAVTATLLVAETNLPTATQEKMGFERAIRDLATGTIYLHQGQYDKSYAALSLLNTALTGANLKREQIRAKLRLAACCLAQGRSTEVVQHLDEIVTILMSQENYETLVHNELRRLPALKQIVKTLPELVTLRRVLHLETEESEARTSPAPAPRTPDLSLTTTNTPQLRIVALGEPAVFLAEKPITHWRMARAMELFYFLLDCGRPQRKEQIVTALWAEVDEHIDRTFHSTIYYLRKAVGEGCLISKGGSYALDLASQYSDVWYDVAEFQSAYKRAKQALDKTDEVATKEEFKALITLYQGDYVQSFYSDWCSSRRDELRRLYLDARHQLASIAWRNAQYDESATHWQHMLAVDGCQEEAHYGLMRYYLHQGKRGLALRQYQRCRDTLQQELAVLPGPTIQKLYQRLIEPL